MPKKPKNEISFEESMAELEKAVHDLESGNLSLDDSIAAFERGVELIRICNAKLESAERKVSALTEKDGAEPEEIPFDERSER